jgi:hypothetical protein
MGYWDCTYEWTWWNYHLGTWFVVVLPQVACWWLSLLVLENVQLLLNRRVHTFPNVILLQYHLKFVYHKFFFNRGVIIHQQTCTDGDIFTMMLILWFVWGYYCLVIICQRILEHIEIIVWRIHYGGGYQLLMHLMQSDHPSQHLRPMAVYVLCQRTGKPGVAEITECSHSPSTSAGAIDQYTPAN